MKFEILRETFSIEKLATYLYNCETSNTGQNISLSANPSFQLFVRSYIDRYCTSHINSLN